MVRLALAATAAGVVAALNNGVGLLPEAGVNTWYAVHEHLSYPNYTWMGGFVLSDWMVTTAQWMIDNGFHAAGYNYMNADDCVVVGRNATGYLIEDPLAFPYGVANTSASLKQLGFNFGFYTDRGNNTCSCYAGGLKRPGSYGYEAKDAAWYAANGVTYIKDDSCFAPSGVQPFTEYGHMRDGLNATGAPIFFSMCWGAGVQVASQGRQYGNNWRIDEDDGGGWAPILQNINTNAGLFNYSGCRDDGFGCGWNDMGLLLVGDPALSDDQARTHFNFWCLLANKLLISVDPATFTANDIATLLNAEALAIDRDPLGIQGQRLVPPFNAARWHADQERMREWRAQTVPSPAGEAGFALPRAYEAKYRVVDPSFDLVMEFIQGTEAAEVAATGGRPEVWARPLAGGAWAALFFNNGLPAAANITCDAACWAAMGWAPTQAVAVRDVWSHTNNGTTMGGLTAINVAVNATVMVKLTAA